MNMINKANKGIVCAIILPQFIPQPTSTATSSMLDVEVKWIPCGVRNQFQNNGKSFNNTVPLEMDFGTFINIFEFVRILLTAVIAGVAALVAYISSEVDFTQVGFRINRIRVPCFSPS